MNGPGPLDDDYLRKHARAGEDWKPARDHLEGELRQRYCQSVSQACAPQTHDMEVAADLYRLGMCSAVREGGQRRR